MAKVNTQDFNGDGISDVLWGNPADKVGGVFPHISSFKFWSMNSAGTIGATGNLQENPFINDNPAGGFVNPGYSPFSSLYGDFDGNGQVNFDDYVLIDQAFNSQGAALERDSRRPTFEKRA